MKYKPILPADTYTIINRSIITEKDKEIVATLYQPIMGYTATSLYYTLLSDMEDQDFMSEDKTHHHLMTKMQLKLEDIVKAREKLN